MFDCMGVAGRAVCGRPDFPAVQCRAAANDQRYASKFSSACAQNKRFVDSCASEGAYFTASCAPSVNAFRSAPLRPETPGYERYAEFNENEFLEAAVNPAILHFWGPKKPWKPCHRPYRKLYHAAMCAVGQIPPRESLLVAWHNLVNAFHLHQVARRVKSVSLTAHK